METGLVVPMKGVELCSFCRRIMPSTYLLVVQLRTSSLSSCLGIRCFLHVYLQYPHARYILQFLRWLLYIQLLGFIVSTADLMCGLSQFPLNFLKFDASSTYTFSRSKSLSSCSLYPKVFVSTSLSPVAGLYCVLCVRLSSRGAC